MSTSRTYTFRANYGLDGNYTSGSEVNTTIAYREGIRGDINFSCNELPLGASIRIATERIQGANTPFITNWAKATRVEPHGFGGGHDIETTYGHGTTLESTRTLQNCDSWFGLDNKHVGVRLLEGSPFEPGKYAFTDAMNTEVELRALELTHFRPSTPFSDLLGENPSVSIQGRFTVFPNLAHSQLTPWEPISDIHYRVRIGHPDLDPEDWIKVDGFVLKQDLQSPDQFGVVAHLDLPDIDLTPLVDAFTSMSRGLPDRLLVEGLGLVDVEGGGRTTTKLMRSVIVDDDRDRRKKPCPPYWGCNPYGLPNRSGVPLGEGPDSMLTLTGNNFEEPAASMGFGWQISAYKKIVEDADGNLTYHDGSGQIERWLKDGNEYHQADPDNYITATKIGSKFRLDFLDRSVMNFDTENRIYTHTDRNGNVVTYLYEPGPNGRLLKVDDGFGRESNFLYDGANKQPASVTTHPGTTGARTTRFTYHTNGQLASIKNHENEITSFTYDDGRLATITDPIGVAQAYTYFPDGRVETETYRGERLVTYSYDDENSMMTVTDSDLSGFAAGSRVNTFYFDALYRNNVIKTIDPAGNETRRYFDDPNNPYLLTRTVTPNADTNYSYNLNGRLVASTDTYGYTMISEHGNLAFPELVTRIVRPAGGGATEMAYDSSGNLIAITDAMNHTTFMTYDGDGFPLSVTNRNGKVTTFEYGYIPKALKAIKTPNENGGVRAITLEYDGFDNITKSINNLGHEIKMTYDGINRLKLLTDARNHETALDYVNGLLHAVSSPANTASSSPRETIMTYDSSGRLKEVFQEIASGSQLKAHYEYDGFSQLRRLSRRKHSGTLRPWEFSYDNLGRSISSKDTLGKESIMAYEPYCKTTSATSAAGVRTVKHMDLLCRLKSVEVGTPGAEALTLGATTESRTFEYDPLGRLISSSQPPSNLSYEAKYGTAKFGEATYSSSGALEGTSRLYTYDVLDRLRTVTFEDNKTALFDYDFEGNLTKMTDPEGKVTNYTYHPNNALAEVRIERDGVEVGKFVYTYDSVGMPVSVKYPTATGIVAEFKSAADVRGWNQNGQLLHLRYIKNGTPIRTFGFEYDAAGNRTVQSDTSASGTVYWKYSYDYLDRLKKVEKGPSSGTLQEVSIYCYDESDNRTKFEMPADLIEYIYDYDDADQIKSRTKSQNGISEFTETFAPDDDGNLLSRTRTTVSPASVSKTSYTWDSFNKLVAVSSTLNGAPSNDAKQQNHYGANGFRRKKKAKSGAVTTEYSAGLATAVAKSTGDP